MNKRAGSQRFPALLRYLGWLAFGLLGLATVLIVARWLVMESGHQATRRIVSTQRKKAISRPPAAPLSSVGSAARGLPLSSVPHFGGALVGDLESWGEFSTKLNEIAKFLQHTNTLPKRKDGVWSFHAILPSMGIEVPETMTESEAAAEYLKQADRFSALLAQWREAVAMGPLDKAADDGSDPSIWRFRALSYSISRLLAMTAEARVQSGDASGAWADWQAMKNSSARLAELYPAHSGYYGSMDYRMFGLARSGMRSGAWTDDQLSEISSMVARENVLASAQRDAEREKKSITNYYMNFHEHEEQFGKDLLKTPSQFDQFVNQVKLKLVTEQQIRDNMEVRLSEVDQRLSRFDPETGFYVRPTEDERGDSGGEGESPGMFGSFYFMIKDLHGGGEDEPESAARYVIKAQSEYDQFRLAAALETYQRRTGTYPDRLDAINDSFPGGAPLDIATGQPYLYQRDTAGGYKLWGTGVDGKSDGGSEETDVTWTQRPVKGK
jgi:hypothetical protein